MSDTMKKPGFFSRHGCKLAATLAGLAASALVLYRTLGASPEQAALEEFAGRGPVAVSVSGPNEPNEPLAGIPDPDNEFVKTALEGYEKYKHLPYVWGGESPCTYEETIKDPFFEGVSISKTQPPGNWRAGQPTVPGFDCAGWVWYIGKKTGKKPFTDVRTSAEHYRTCSSGEKIWNGKYSAKMEEKMEPGDLIFMMRNGKAYHVAMYLGYGKIMECSGREPPNYNDIPPNYWKAWRGYAEPEKHGRTDCDRGGLQISSLKKYSDKIISVRRF